MIDYYLMLLVFYPNYQIGILQVTEKKTFISISSIQKIPTIPNIQDR